MLNKGTGVISRARLVEYFDQILLDNSLKFIMDLLDGELSHPRQISVLMFNKPLGLGKSFNKDLR